MAERKEAFLKEKTLFLKRLDKIEAKVEEIEKQGLAAATCSLTCKICQCVECKDLGETTTPAK